MPTLNERRYFGWRITKGDASRASTDFQGVPSILLPVPARDLHLASAADEGTDWNYENPTHPTLLIHSETTPATDYMSLAHDGCNAILTVAGGNFRLACADLVVANTFGLIVGHTAQQTISDGGGATDNIPEMQVLGTAQPDSTLMVGLSSATDALGPMLALVKSGNAAIGSRTAVVNNEYLGRIIAFGDDGTDLESPAAEIRFTVDGTVGTGIMPGAIELYTTPACSETLTLRGQWNAAGDYLHANGAGIVVGNTAQVSVNAS